MKHKSYFQILKAILTVTVALTAGLDLWAQPTSQTFTASGTFTIPPNVTQLTVECWGAGGGGSTITNNNRRGGGGGGGAYSSSVISVVPGTSYTITVGTGGAGNTAGGNSVFGTNVVVASGGSGASANSTTAGNGGTIASSVGTIRYAGGNGANGDVTASYSGGGGGAAGSTGTGGSANGSAAGVGTSLFGGSGGAGVTGSSIGQNGSVYGGGGSGGCTNSNTDRNGGNGANGQIVVSYVSSLVFTADGNYAIPAGVTRVKVETWGGGGGGSSIIANGRRGGGGGGGAYASSIVTVVPLNIYPVVVGNGGVSAASSTDGGASSFGTTLVIAAGGKTGTFDNATGGAGGTVAASTGTVRNAGGSGANGGAANSGGGGGGAGSSGNGSNANLATGGAGAALNGGTGGNGVSGSAVGLVGGTYGGGGSGAVTNSNTDRNGGSGAKGLVIITLPANVALSSPGQVSADNVFQGTTKWPVYTFETSVTTANALVTDISFNTAGTYAASDITRFQLYYNTTNDLATATQIGGNLTTSLGTGSHSFTGLSQLTYAGSTGYFWITADITSAATANATLSVNAIATTDLIYELATVSGAASSGGIQTVQAIPRVTIASSGQVAAGNVNQGVVGHQMFRFTTAVTTADADMNSLTFSTATSGTFSATDIVNFKLWYNSTNDFASAYQIGSPIIGSLGTGSHTFTDINVTTYAGNTGYFWITTDVAPFPVNGHSFYISAITTGNITYATPAIMSGTTTAGGIQTILTVNGVMLSSTFPAVSANSILQGSTGQRIFKFSTIITGSSVTLNSVAFTTNGTYAASDVVNFKLLYNTVNSTVGATQLGATLTTGLGPGAHSISGFSQATAAGATGYFWITADIASAAVPGHTLSVSPITTSNLGYSGSPAKGGSTFAGGVQTIQLKVDTEGDNVADVYDLDDDNDGIPDYNENLSCNATVAELFPNSNFDAGNTGFYSGYGYVTIVDQTSLYPEGIYAITDNANSGHDAFADCSSGHGNMMVVNGSSNPNLIVWSSGTISVSPNTDYTLTINLTSVNPGNPAQLIFNVNGENIGLQFNATTTNCEWVPGIAIWNSGSNTSATFDIMNLNLAPGGNDFAIDDISCKYKINCDTDGDGVPDKMDLDSDNDGIYDVVEAGGTATAAGTISGYADADLDGLSDNVDNISSGSGGTDIFNGTPLTNPDTDGDGLRNLIDLESDVDGCYDVIEAGFTDGNNDGILGSAPVTVNSQGVVTSASGYTTPVDANSDGTRDYVQRIPLITVQPINRSICTVPATGTTFSVTATNTGGTYQWQVSTNGGGSWSNVSNGGVYSGATTATLTIGVTVTSAYDGYMYHLLLSNPAFKCSPLISDAVTLRVSGSAPVISGSITGDAIVCPNATGLNYSISAVSSATSYTWTVPAGWSILSGQNTISITASSAATGGNITVTATNACGTSPATSLAISINTPSPSFTTPVSGTACQSADVTYTTQSGKSNYIWTIGGTAGADYTITSGGTNADNTLVLKWLTTGSKTVSVNYTSGGCQGATAASNTITVNANAIILTQPVSPAAFCAGAGTVNLAITASGTISSYQWQVSTDAGGSWTNLSNSAPYSNVTTNTLTITNPAAGLNNAQYHCVVTGSCGAVTSNAATLTINSIPAVPGAITGTAAQCPGTTGQTYSIAAVASATTYSWTVPTGWSITAGAGTISITVTAGSAGQNGNITVTAGNTCGTSAANSLAVSVYSIPVIADKSTTIQSGQTFTVTPVNGTDIVPAGTTYSWALPSVTGSMSGGTTGTNAASISGTLVNSTNSNQTATYTVTPTASSCPGNSFIVTVTVYAVPAISDITATTCSGNSFTITPVDGTNGLVPAGTTYSWSAPAVDGGITGGAAGTDAAAISGTLTNPTNAVHTATYTVTPKIGSVTGNTFTVTVTVNPVPAINPMIGSVCSGTAITVTPVNTTDGIVPAGTTYSWPAPVVTGGMTGGSSGTNANSISATFVNPTTLAQTATFTITPVSGTCTGSSFTLTVTVNALPVVTITSETNVCEGTTITLEAGTGFADYQWKSGATVIGTAHSQDITTGAVSTSAPVIESYSVTVTDSNGCVSTDNQDISVYHKPETGPDFYVPNEKYR